MESGQQQQPNWGTVGRISAIAGIVIGLVLFLAIPEQRWIGVAVAVLSLLEGYFLATILPQMLRNRGDG